MAAEELVGCVLAISIYQFWENIGQEKKGYYLSVLTRASEVSKMVEALSTFNISYCVFVS